MRKISDIFEIVEKTDLMELKKYLADYPKGMNEKNEAGVPALHLAVEKGNLAFVRHVIEYAIVNPDLLDGMGNTILHYGVRSGNLELVKYLVERVDSPIEWANKENVTPYDLAIALGSDELCGFFVEQLGCTMDEMYHNPIRRGLHPDPSVVRVGEDYYMVNSSFLYFPCIPISHSKDLISWEVIGHAITDPKWARLKDLEGGRGYWAPDISYYEGRFYITATYRLNDGTEKVRYQMVTSAERPEGPYDEPVFLDEDGIDPSIFTDLDGRRYMLLNRGARIFEISKDGKEILSEPRLLWYGHNKQASEGPHLLYKDGYYYLFMAEGGTGMGHRISVARSKSLDGPYESCPYNPILRQWDERRQLQCCGHGKPVQTPEGEWYMVYLCNRYGPGGYAVLGRETAMDPISWTADGWPLVNALKGPSDLQKLPAGSSVRNACAKKTEAGALKVFAPDEGIWGEWSTVRGFEPGSFAGENGKLILRGNGRDLNSVDYCIMLVKPQPDFDFEMMGTVKVDTATPAETCECDEAWDAGLTCYYDENSFVKLAIGMRCGKVGILAAEYVDNGYVTDVFVPVAGISKGDTVQLRIVTRDLQRCCYFRIGEDAEWQQAALFENTSYLSSEGLNKGKRFTGATAGIYVHGKVSGIFSEVEIK